MNVTYSPNAGRVSQNPTWHSGADRFDQRSQKETPESRKIIKRPWRGVPAAIRRSVFLYAKISRVTTPATSVSLKSRPA